MILSVDGELGRPLEALEGEAWRGTQLSIDYYPREVKEFGRTPLSIDY